MASILDRDVSITLQVEARGGARSPVNRLGFWSAVLTTVWTVWFMAAFAIWMSGQPIDIVERRK